ncbi:protein downstream neighbor of son homolog isoform X2 [Agrilus planipennis]|nr:protein downstream neighbor of son homolog isoform X2 [Agrilus planipennis]
MRLYCLKLKEKQLKARINCSKNNALCPCSENILSINVSTKKSEKRKNPFVCSTSNKREKTETYLTDIEASADQTLFTLFNFTSERTANIHSATSFANVLNGIDDNVHIERSKVIKGESWIPVDWSLKSKMRFISDRPFPWNQKLKISEEASGITSFVRCLGSTSEITLDTSSNAKFHQCCLYWQQPVFPWLKLFPRTSTKISTSGTSMPISTTIKHSLQTAWSDSIRSLFQLIRTRQCPYFYVCANNYTILFRAAGICGHSELHVMVTPTTRGFRQLLRQEEIEFKMPLKKKPNCDQGYETTTQDTVVDSELNDEEDEGDDEEDWLLSLGMNADEIKQINYKQQKMKFKGECEVDNSEQSLIVIEGAEVNSFFNFLLNCKSAVSTTGPLAGIPPTLLAPVAFNGATLNSIKVRESKVHFDNVDYYSLELNGPILPHAIHNLCEIYPREQSFTATFANIKSTVPLCHVKISNFSNSSAEKGKVDSGSAVFGQVNLSDCGLNSKILKQFCSADSKRVESIDCLKYTAETKTYTWS